MGHAASQAVRSDTLDHVSRSVHLPMAPRSRGAAGREDEPMNRALALIAAAVLLAGCSSPAPAATTTPTVAATSATPTPTPTPEAATPEQFASIIAGKESDWREVIDSSFDCRFIWTMGAADAAEEAQATACYLREITIVMSTDSASKDMRALTPSADMEPLVADTLETLDLIRGVDLEGVCGKAFDGPKESDDCDRTLGELNAAYVALGKVLDKWKPYT